MAKSMRSKRKKRLRAIRREMVEPFYDKKEAAKLAAQEAALAAPKLPVKASPAADAMDVAAEATPSFAYDVDDDVEMASGNPSSKFLKPVGKKLKRKLKIFKPKPHGKGKIRRKPNV